MQAITVVVSISSAIPLAILPIILAEAGAILTQSAFLARLRRFGYEVIEPDSGYLACGDTGRGKMPSPESLLWYILKETAYEKDMKGIKLCVTAGPTREAIDPVRFISNNSTGKMGYAIARMAMLRGADVHLYQERLMFHQFHLLIL